MTDQEIIASLAEKVMGWKVCQNGFAVDPRFGVHALGATYPFERLGWNPLECIADAWMLAERCHLTVTPGAKGWRAQSCNWHQSGETTAVGMTNYRDWYEAETAPRAICLAALKVIEAEAA
jgi:hypothetical protein